MYRDIKRIGLLLKLTVSLKVDICVYIDMYVYRKHILPLGAYKGGKGYMLR